MCRRSAHREPAALGSPRIRPRQRRCLRKFDPWFFYGNVITHPPARVDEQLLLYQRGGPISTPSVIVSLRETFPLVEREDYTVYTYILRAEHHTMPRYLTAAFCWFAAAATAFA